MADSEAKGGSVEEGDGTRTGMLESAFSADDYVNNKTPSQLAAEAEEKEEKERKRVASEKEKSEALAKQIEMRERVRAAHEMVETTKGLPEYVDGRTLYRNIQERRFNYNVETGKLTCSFETLPTEAMHYDAFRNAIATLPCKDALTDLQYEANVNQVELDLENVRALMYSQYAEMKKSCQEELEHKMSCTAGYSVFMSRQAYVTPQGYARWDSDTTNEASEEGIVSPSLAAYSTEGPEDFPFNFGWRLRKLSGPGADTSLYFACCANDVCRRKNFIISYDTYVAPVKVVSHLRHFEHKPPSLKPFALVVEDHLKEKHWGQLLQTGWAEKIETREKESKTA